MAHVHDKRQSLVTVDYIKLPASYLCFSYLCSFQVLLYTDGLNRYLFYTNSPSRLGSCKYSMNSRICASQNSQVCAPGCST